MKCVTVKYLFFYPHFPRKPEKKKEMTAQFTRYTTDINSVKDFYIIFKKKKI